MANVLLQKYGHFYSKPAAGSDFSAACSTIMFGSLAVFTVVAFKGFYWALVLALVFLFGMSQASKAFNPTNFIRKEPIMFEAHKEIIKWITGDKENRIDKS